MVLVLGSVLVVIEDSWGWYYGVERDRWNSGDVDDIDILLVVVW